MLHGSCNGGLTNKSIWKPLVEHVDSSSSHRCAYIPFITLCTHRHPMHEINISCVINKKYHLFCLMVNVHIGSVIFLRFLFVLFVNFGMKCLPKRNENIQSGLQVATEPGCMEVQTAVRRNLICGVQGDRACISISRRHSCSRKHTGILQVGTTLPLFGISRLREGSPCQSGAAHN